MEKGKRIEFKKAAKIVILAIVILMITGITAIGIAAGAKETVVAFEDHGYTVKITFPDGEGIARTGSKEFVLRDRDEAEDVNLIDVRGQDTSKVISISIEIEGASDNDWSLYRWQNEFHWPFYRPVDVDRTTNEFRVLPIAVGPIASDLRHRFYTRIYKITVRELEKENQPQFDIYFTLVLDGKKISETKPTTKKEEYTLTLEHYPLFPYLDELKEIKESGEVVFRQDRGIGGDLRATLKNKDGKGKSNELVYFYVEEDTPLYRVLGNSITPYHYWEEICNHIDNVDIHSYIGTARTNSEGIASLNCISEKSIRPNVLMEKLVKHDGKVNGTVKAVVVKFLGKTEWKIECEASVPVEFNSMAKIMKIEGNGVLDKLPIGKRQGTISGPGQVRVQRGLFQPNLDLNTSQKEGFELMPADIINIDGDTSIEIVWINGDRAKLIVPKTVGVKEDQPVGSINFILASSAYYSGFYTHGQDLVESFGGVTYEKGINMMLDTIKDMVPGISTAEKSYEFVVEIIEKTKKIDISHVSILTKIRIRSKVIIDSAGDEILVYNIEGSPDIKTVKGEEVTLADKEMVAIAENGSLSEVQSFDPEEVLNEFFNTLNGSITIKAETASTVERETVKLTVMGVAGDPIRVESSPLSDNVLFKDGIDDTPTGANYHVNWFTDTIDADGIRRYAVEFNDMGIYTIKVTVTGGDREGDSDTVDITVLEKEVPLDLPAPIPSKLEISKLYVGKSVYPRGTEVDVYYDVKNIGTVDVDEFYVECRINDLKGNEMYKFVGSTLSIASGKRQKFVAAEKWKIPSNAKLGPYKITATVKWNSRTHTKTTNEELFVTIATISENSKAELEISELYTLKKEYSRNEKVEMCYCVKNIGSKKVKQSHMRCAFINPNGEKLEWFITAPFSLAGKDKRKRCFTGESAVWKIPSDAEQGTYTIEVTVIWGSKSHTKTTDFKVK